MHYCYAAILRGPPTCRLDVTCCVSITPVHEKRSARLLDNISVSCNKQLTVLCHCIPLLKMQKRMYSGILMCAIPPLRSRRQNYSRHSASLCGYLNCSYVAFNANLSGTRNRDGESTQAVLQAYTASPLSCETEN